MIEYILDRLEGVKKSGKGYMAKCSAHDDKNPSLSLMESSNGQILIHCFAGCAPLDIITSIGLSLSDLYPDGSLGEFRGFEQIKASIKKKQNPQRSLDKTLLDLCQSRRNEGIKLNAHDLELEKQAFLRLRNETAD